MKFLVLMEPKIYNRLNSLNVYMIFIQIKSMKAAKKNTLYIRVYRVRICYCCSPNNFYDFTIKQSCQPAILFKTMTQKTKNKTEFRLKQKEDQ